MNYLKLLLSRTAFTKYIQNPQISQPTQITAKILEQITQNKELKSLQGYMQKIDDDRIQMKSLGLIVLMLIKKKGIEDYLEDALIKNYQSKGWMSDKLIAPIRQIILQCCQNPSLIQAVQNKQVKSSSFLKEIPLIVSIITSILNISEPIIKLSRYFFNSHDSHYYIFFVKSYLCLLDSFYSYLKLSLQSTLFVLTKNKEQIDKVKEIVKQILVQVMPKVSEKVQNLNSNKYFKNWEQKIGLFKIEELSEKVQYIAKQIINDSQNQRKSISPRKLKALIFPGDGTFNDTLFSQIISTPAMSPKISTQSQKSDCPTLETNQSLVFSEN